MARRSKKKQLTNASFDYKERVCEALVECQVPVRIAEIAVIDLRTNINVGFHNKLSARETAAGMLKQVDKIYKTEDKWHYGY